MQLNFRWTVETFFQKKMSDGRIVLRPHDWKEFKTLHGLIDYMQVFEKYYKPIGYTAEVKVIKY